MACSTTEENVVYRLALVRAHDNLAACLLFSGDFVKQQLRHCMVGIGFVGWTAFTVRVIAGYDGIDIGSTWSLATASVLSVCALGTPVVLCRSMLNNCDSSLRIGEWIWIEQSAWAMLFMTSTSTGVGGLFVFVSFLICQVATCFVSLGVIWIIMVDYYVEKTVHCWTEFLGAIIGFSVPILYGALLLNSNIAI